MVLIYEYIMEYYSVTRNNEILPFGTMWMDLENIMLREVNQIDKVKEPYDLTHM